MRKYINEATKWLILRDFRFRDGRNEAKGSVYDAWLMDERMNIACNHNRKNKPTATSAETLRFRLDGWL
jgi:hypothetical protein